jgi:hypothetical protein
MLLCNVELRTQSNKQRLNWRTALGWVSCRRNNITVIAATPFQKAAASQLHPIFCAKDLKWFPARISTSMLLPGDAEPVLFCCSAATPLSLFRADLPQAWLLQRYF